MCGPVLSQAIHVLGKASSTKIIRILVTGNIVSMYLLQLICLNVYYSLILSCNLWTNYSISIKYLKLSVVLILLLTKDKSYFIKIAENNSVLLRKIFEYWSYLGWNPSHLTHHLKCSDGRMTLWMNLIFVFHLHLVI